MTADHADTETRSQFAARVGVTPGRISQLVGQGLPLTEDRKRVRVAAALDWMSRTLDPAQVAAQRRPKPEPIRAAWDVEVAPNGGVREGAGRKVEPVAQEIAAPETAAPEASNQSRNARLISDAPASESQTADYHRARLARDADPEHVEREVAAPDESAPEANNQVRVTNLKTDGDFNERKSALVEDTDTAIPDGDDDPLDDDGIPSGDYLEARRRHEWLRAQKARLLLDQARGNLAPWAEVNDALAEWAGREREAWLRWAITVVPALSAEIKVEGAVLAPALRRAVEDHIRTLASEAAPHVGP